MDQDSDTEDEDELKNPFFQFNRSVYLFPGVRKNRSMITMRDAAHDLLKECRALFNPEFDTRLHVALEWLAFTNGVYDFVTDLCEGKDEISDLLRERKSDGHPKDWRTEIIPLFEQWVSLIKYAIYKGKDEQVLECLGNPAQMQRKWKHFDAIDLVIDEMESLLSQYIKLGSIQEFADYYKKFETKVNDGKQAMVNLFHDDPKLDAIVQVMKSFAPDSVNWGDSTKGKDLKDFSDIDWAPPTARLISKQSQPVWRYEQTEKTYDIHFFPHGDTEQDFCTCEILDETQTIHGCQHCGKLISKITFATCQALTDCLQTLLRLSQFSPRMNYFCYCISKHPGTERRRNREVRCPGCLFPARKTPDPVNEVFCACKNIPVTDEKFVESEFHNWFVTNFIMNFTFENHASTWFTPEKIHNRQQMIAKKLYYSERPIVQINFLIERNWIYQKLYKAAVCFMVLMEQKYIEEDRPMVGLPLPMDEMADLSLTMYRFCQFNLIPSHFSFQSTIVRRRGFGRADMTSTHPQRLYLTVKDTILEIQTKLNSVWSESLKLSQLEIFYNFHRFESLSDLNMAQSVLLDKIFLYKCTSQILDLIAFLLGKYFQFPETCGHTYVPWNIKLVDGKVVHDDGNIIYGFKILQKKLQEFYKRLFDLHRRVMNIKDAIQGDRRVSKNEEDRNIIRDFMKLKNGCAFCGTDLLKLNISSSKSCDVCEQTNYCSQQCKDLNKNIHSLICDADSKQAFSKFAFVSNMDYAVARREIESKRDKNDYIFEPDIKLDKVEQSDLNTNELFTQIRMLKDRAHFKEFEKDFEILLTKTKTKRNKKNKRKDNEVQEIANVEEKPVDHGDGFRADNLKIPEFIMERTKREFDVELECENCGDFIVNGYMAYHGRHCITDVPEPICPACQERDRTIDFRTHGPHCREEFLFKFKSEPLNYELQLVDPTQRKYFTQSQMSVNVLLYDFLPKTVTTTPIKSKKKKQESTNTCTGCVIVAEKTKKSYDEILISALSDIALNALRVYRDCPHCPKIQEHENLIRKAVRNKVDQGAASQSLAFTSSKTRKLETDVVNLSKRNLRQNRKRGYLKETTEPIKNFLLNDVFAKDPRTIVHGVVNDIVNTAVDRVHNETDGASTSRNYLVSMSNLPDERREEDPMAKARSKSLGLPLEPTRNVYQEEEVDEDEDAEVFFKQPQPQAQPQPPSPPAPITVRGRLEQLIQDTVVQKARLGCQIVWVPPNKQATYTEQESEDEAEIHDATSDEEKNAEEKEEKSVEGADAAVEENVEIEGGAATNQELRELQGYNLVIQEFPKAINVFAEDGTVIESIEITPLEKKGGFIIVETEDGHKLVEAQPEGEEQSEVVVEMEDQGKEEETVNEVEENSDCEKDQKTENRGEKCKENSGVKDEQKTDNGEEKCKENFEENKENSTNESSGKEEILSQEDSRSPLKSKSMN